jgi:hypothetical protein
MRSWIRAVETEVMASLHDQRASLDALARAQHLISDEASSEPEWFDFFNAPRLAGFAGHAYLTLNQPQAARPYLEQSHADLEPTASKQRAVVLADIASTYLQDDLEASCAFSEQALDQLQESWYATAFERIQSVYRQLAPHQRAHQVRELRDRIQSVLPSALANRQLDA